MFGCSPTLVAWLEATGRGNMSIFMWKFNKIPDPRDVECFIDEQMPLFSRNARHLTGGDGEPIVDLMRVEHNCGAVNLEFQLNGIEGQSGDVFCFPGYYPGDMDDEGNPLFNYCDTVHAPGVRFGSDSVGPVK